MEPELAMTFYSQLPSFKTIQFLVLRCNSITDDLVNCICQGITALGEECQLKVLDLYDNKIAKEGFRYLGDMILLNNSLELLGLAKNIINKIEDLDGLFQSLGKVPLTESELEEYRIKEKERNDIIEKNKKIRKKEKKIPVPHLDPILEINGNWVMTKNNKLIFLSLAMNNLGDESWKYLEQFLQRQEYKFQFVLSLNNFSNELKEQQRKKNWKQKLFL